MQSKKKSVVAKPIIYTEAPNQAIPGLIPVVSTNKDGFTITTMHIYERGAEWERQQRVLRGEVLAEDNNWKRNI